MFSCSCKQENNSYLEINNEALKREIIDYYTEIKLIETDSLLPVVVYRQINDSISNYYITVEHNVSNLNNYPFHFIIKLDDMDVFFVIEGMNTSTFGGKNFFKIKKETISTIAQKHFPKDYEYFLKNNEFNSFVLWEGKIRRLTFLKDSLISKKEVMDIYD